MKNETEGVPITALREVRILKELRHPSVVTVVSMIVQRQCSSRCSFPPFAHDVDSSNRPAEKLGDVHIYGLPIYGT